MKLKVGACCFRLESALSFDSFATKKNNRNKKKHHVILHCFVLNILTVCVQSNLTFFFSTIVCKDLPVHCLSHCKYKVCRKESSVPRQTLQWYMYTTGQASSSERHAREALISISGRKKKQTNILREEKLDFPFCKKLRRTTWRLCWKQRSQWYQNETERLVFLLFTIESFFERFRVQIVIFFSSASLLSLRLQRLCTCLVSTVNPFVTKSLSDLQLWTLPALETLMCTNLVKLMWFKKSAENAETRVLLQRSFLSIVGFTAYHLACEMLRLYIRHHQKLTFVSLTINPTVFLLAKRIRALHWARKSSVCVVSISFTIVTLCW